MSYSQFPQSDGVEKIFKNGVPSVKKKYFLTGVVLLRLSDVQKGDYSREG